MSERVSIPESIRNSDEILTLISELLFTISQIEEEKPRDEYINNLAKKISELSHSRRLLSDRYFEITNLDERVAVKAHLKYYADIASELIQILKSLDSNIGIHDMLIKAYKLIEGKASLIEMHDMELAQRELDVFNDQSFKNMLEGIMDYQLFEREQKMQEKQTENSEPPQTDENLKYMKEISEESKNKSE